MNKKDIKALSHFVRTSKDNEIKKCAKTGNRLTEDRERSLSLQKEALGIIKADERKLHGMTSSKRVRDLGEIISNFSIPTNLINYVPMIPFFAAPFSGLGSLSICFGIGAAVGFSKLTTLSMEVAVDRSKGKELMAHVATLLCLCLNAGSTGLGGIGMLMINQRELLSTFGQEQMVEELIQTAQRTQADLLSSPGYKAIEDDCEARLAKYHQLKAAGELIAAGEVFYHASGPFGVDRTSVPFEKLKPCEKRDRLRDEARAAGDKKVAAINQERLDGKSDQEILKTHALNKYEQKFNDEGMIKSDLDTFSFAWKFFSYSVEKGEYSRIGLPLAVFGLSVITSTGLLALLIFYSLLPEVKKSFDHERNDRFFKALDKMIYELGVEDGHGKAH